MPKVQMRLMYDNGEVYVSEKHEVKGLGVLLVDTMEDTTPDQMRLRDSVTLLEDVSSMHRDEYPDVSDIDPVAEAPDDR